jgi:hypothetical protein
VTTRADVERFGEALGRALASTRERDAAAVPLAAGSPA